MTALQMALLPASLDSAAYENASALSTLKAKRMVEVIKEAKP